MKRAIFVALSLLMFVFAVVIFGSALSLHVAPTVPRATGTARVVTLKVWEVVTSVPTTRPTAQATATRLPLQPTVGPCWWGGPEGSLCVWPTATQTLPLADCPPPTPASGQMCRWTYRQTSPAARGSEQR
jgi:hypothetical protein